VSAAATHAAEAPKITLALVGGRIVDGYEGRPIEDGVILIAGERIAALGPRSSLTVPAGVTTIDTRGMTVLPGLADMHVHLMILGHGDYEHWDTTYRGRFRDEIMPAAARSSRAA
jgi:imidazolonepropionase-like amidohydrolase